MYALPFISTTTSKKPKHEQKNKHNAKKDKYFSTKIFEQRFAIYFFHNHILNESQAHKYRCTRTHSLTHAYTYSLSLPPRSCILSCSSPSLPHSPVRITAIPPASAILTWLSALKARFLFFFFDEHLEYAYRHSGHDFCFPFLGLWSIDAHIEGQISV